MTVRPPQTPIAIVGMSAIVPGTGGVEGFWRDVLSGRDLITEVPPDYWLVDDYYDPDPSTPDKTYCRNGSFLSPVDFDPLSFGVPPAALPATDTSQLLALLAAERVLADVGDDLGSVDKDRVSVILGTAPLELLTTMAGRVQRPVWLKALREGGAPESQAQEICDRIAANYVPWQESTFPGLLSNVVAGRIAHRYDLHGTNCTVDAACASSLAALSNGVNELALGHADMVVTGGIDTLNDILMYMCFSKTPAMSPTGDCRPFSDAADGTILGEGVVLFALRRLDDAERDGNRVHAVIRGIGTSSDGRSTAIYAPLPQGQARAVRRAYESAGYGPETVGLVEAHGTGTSAGDIAEFTALRDVFAASGSTDQRCALGSVKSQLGHLKAAAGAVGLLKAVLAVSHKVLPPTIKVRRPNPRLDVATSPFHLNTVARPWISPDGQPRRAAVSSFGFGGSNYHLTIEEYTPNGAGRRPVRQRTASAELVPLSASSPAELRSRCENLGPEGLSLPALAHRLQEDFDPTAPARLTVVATSRADLAVKLTTATRQIEEQPGTAFAAPAGIYYGTGEPDAGQVAFLFPGQGSQYVGMSTDVTLLFTSAQATWDRIAALRFEDHGLGELVFPVPVFADDDRAAQESALTRTEWAQPALAAHSVVLLNLLADLGMRPDCTGGHSFGELVALHAAGAYDETTLLNLARRRGELMRDAATEPGAMIAVAASLPAVEKAVDELGRPDLVVANHNAPEQVVLAGPSEAISAMRDYLVNKGVTVRELDTATAFHSPLVAPAAAGLAEFLDGLDVKPPSYDVYSNTHAGIYRADADDVRRRLAEQLSAPVQFVAQIEAMYARGVRTFVEVGAGDTLTGLVRRILGERPHRAVALDRRGKDGVVSLCHALGELASAGVRIDFSALWRDHAIPLDGSPAAARFTVPIRGTNYGKPYPPEGGTAALPPANPEAAAWASASSAWPEGVDTPSPAHRLQALVDAQRQVAATHTGYQDAMARSHDDFLRFAELSLTVTSVPKRHPTSTPDVHTAERLPSVRSPQVAAPPLSRRVLRVMPVAPSGLALPGLRNVPLVITGDGAGIAELVAAKFVAHGVKAVAADHVPADARGVVFLGGLREVHTVDEAIAINREAFTLARTAARGLSADGGVFVTVQDTGGAFGISGAEPVRAWLGGIAALTRTVAKECPLAAVRAIDCARGSRTPEQIADALVDELLRGGSPLDVGLGPDGERVTVVAVEESAGNDAPLLDQDSVVVVTGGARGITAEVVRAMARAHSPKFVLLGRTPLLVEGESTRAVDDPVQLRRLLAERGRGEDGPAVTLAEVGRQVSSLLASREVRTTLRELEAVGSPARYFEVDVRNRTAVAAALNEARAEWGAITGVLHGAGVLADRMLVDKTDEDLASVFDTKVLGLSALLDATAGDPLQVLCVFSSVIARVGNAGQSDYAMANEVVAQVACAEQARRPYCRVSAIAWGPWRGGMVGGDLAAHFERQGVGLIDPAEGGRAGFAELSARDVVAVITAGDGFGVKPEPRAEVTLSGRTHPELADHAIENVPVLPIALVLQWFGALAREHDAAGPVVLGDIAVVRGIRLPHLADEPSTFTLRLAGGTAELTAADGTVHYRAVASVEPPVAAVFELEPDLQPTNLAEVYDGQVLFHGPAWQAICSVERLSPEGAVAALTGALDLGWTASKCAFADPVVLDGALQLAVVWAARCFGAAALPVAVRRFALHRTGPVREVVRCVVRGLAHGGDQATCDIAVVDGDGGLRAEFREVRLIRRPG